MNNAAIRIVFITHYTNLHGANRSLMNLIEGLKPLGIIVGVVCPAKGPITDELERLEIPNVILPFADWLSQSRQGRWYRLWRNLTVLPALMKKVREWNADVIYTNSSVTPVGAFAAALLRKPHIWHIREFGLLDYRRKPDWGAAFFRLWLNRAQAVIAISDAVKKAVLKDVRVQTAVVYNGVISRAEMECLKQGMAGENHEVYTFAMLSQISSNKNQEEAIRAFAAVAEGHPQVRLLIAGNDRGEYAKRVKVLCEQLGVAGRVAFLGYVSNPWAVLRQTDAVLMCSRYEAMGRVTAEAMSAGKPVIGYRNAGTAEIIEHERDGLLYEGNDEDLAQCMVRLIKNPAWGTELGANGMEKAEQRFTSEVCAGHVYEVIKDALKMKGPSG